MKNVLDSQNITAGCNVVTYVVLLSINNFEWCFINGQRCTITLRDLRCLLPNNPKSCKFKFNAFTILEFCCHWLSFRCLSNQNDMKTLRSILLVSIMWDFMIMITNLTADERASWALKCQILFKIHTRLYASGKVSYYQTVRSLEVTIRGMALCDCFES